MAANNATGVKPRTLICPSFSDDVSVTSALDSVAKKIGAMVYCEATATSRTAAIDFGRNFGSRRVWAVTPKVKTFDTELQDYVYETPVAYAAGARAATDISRGFWKSISNIRLVGVEGTSRDLEGEVGDSNSEVNLLNQNNIAAILRVPGSGGWRTYGNRTLSDDPKWKFESTVRINDVVNDAITSGTMWAVDEPLTPALAADIVAGVNELLRKLNAAGALVGGDTGNLCWFDSELNTPESMADGNLYLDFKLTPAAPAEQIVFRSHLVNDGYSVFTVSGK